MGGKKKKGFGDALYSLDLYQYISTRPARIAIRFLASRLFALCFRSRHPGPESAEPWASKEGLPTGEIGGAGQNHQVGLALPSILGGWSSFSSLP